MLPDSSNPRRSFRLAAILNQPKKRKTSEESSTSSPEVSPQSSRKASKSFADIISFVHQPHTITSVTTTIQTTYQTFANPYPSAASYIIPTLHPSGLLAAPPLPSAEMGLDFDPYWSPTKDITPPKKDKPIKAPSPANKTAEKKLSTEKPINKKPPQSEPKKRTRRAPYGVVHCRYGCGYMYSSTRTYSKKVRDAFDYHEKAACKKLPSFFCLPCSRPLASKELRGVFRWNQHIG